MNDAIAGAILAALEATLKALQETWRDVEDLKAWKASLTTDLTKNDLVNRVAKLEGRES